MPSSPSPSLQLELQAAGENLNTWGAPRLNTALGMLEAGSHGLTDHTLSGPVSLTYTNYTLTNGTDFNQRFTSGSTGSFTLTLGGFERTHLIINASSFSQTVNCSGGGDSVVIQAGEAALIYCDAVNVTRLNLLRATGDFAVTGTGSFTGQVSIPATPDSDTSAASKRYVDEEVLTAASGNLPGFTGNNRKFVQVNDDGTGYRLRDLNAPLYRWRRKRA